MRLGEVNQISEGSYAYLQPDGRRPRSWWPGISDRRHVTGDVGRLPSRLTFFPRLVTGENWPAEWSI